MGIKDKLKNAGRLSLADFSGRYGPYLVGALLLLLLGGFFLFQRTHRPQEENVTELESFQIETDQSDAEIELQDPNPPAIWYVDVKGAVKRPGMIQVEEGMRVQDAVDLVGGFADQADLNQVNLSQKLTDQMVVYVPVQGEEVSTLPASRASEVQTGGQSGKSAALININTADSQELQKISGIGEKKAADIIAYRESHGSFQSVDELTQVSGIGAKTLEKMREQVTVN